MLKVEVRSRIVGTFHPDEQPSNVAIDLLNEHLTVRELITQTVEEQVRDLLIHRKLDNEKARQILQRQYLTEEEIQKQATSGVVKQPSKKPHAYIDSAVQVNKAILAFDNGTFMIVVDGRQLEDLDEMIALSPSSKVTFVRMTPLVGG